MTQERTFEIKYSKVLLGTPALLLVPYAWVEMIENWTIDSFTVPVNDNYEVVWIEEDNRAVALMTFRELTNEMWICLAYVKESHRQLGLYTKMFTRVENISLDRKLRRVSGGTWLTNLTMDLASRSVGRTPYVQLYKKDLDPDAPRSLEDTDEIRI